MHAFSASSDDGKSVEVTGYSEISVGEHSRSYHREPPSGTAGRLLLFIMCEVV